MLRKLLIANRGEIAIRIARSTADLGMSSVAVYSGDDAASLHVGCAEEARQLKGQGAAAYLDIGELVRAARECSCDAVHPGYGFLSESAAFAAAVRNAGMVFVGPSAQALELFGDKVRARLCAKELNIPVLEGSPPLFDAASAEAFMRTLNPGEAMMLKAVAGGGGRGMRAVHDLNELPAVFARCASEAQASFGNPALFAERYLPSARHIEVQIIGDGVACRHLFDRDCSIQRQRQKLIEIAPAPALSDTLRGALESAALTLATSAGYSGVGTVEFLVDTERNSFAFIECNPRLQVEHTVTEQVLGVDLVALQLRIAGGARIDELDLGHAPKGHAVQCRINLETMDAHGESHPAAGRLSVYEPCSGPGVRVDGFGYSGYATSTRFDSLLAKVIVHSQGGSDAAIAKAARALRDFRIGGVSTNLPYLRALLSLLKLQSVPPHTTFIEKHAEELFQATLALSGDKVAAGNDPLAVLALGKQTRAPAQVPEGSVAVAAPLSGTVIGVAVQEGQSVKTGQALFVLESMKMEHEIEAPRAGIVRRVAIAVGETVNEGEQAILIESADSQDSGDKERGAVPPDLVRADLKAVLDRRQGTLDAERPEAVARRRKTRQRTARENLADLLDADSFIEYGALTVAARRRRHSLEELIQQTPADGLVMGLGRVNGERFGDADSRCAVMAYDYTVLAGTQGAYNHRKMDRLIELALRWQLPTFFFCEGGGGRPGDTEGGGFTRGFELWARMSGVAPLMGITSGRCFAGNASVLGCCDVIIATKDSNIGMGGPAMIEGGGLGLFHPEDIGPVSVQEPNGVIDLVADDERHAVRLAREYVAYFQGSHKEFTCSDQRLLRHAIPENRVRVYDILELIRLLADTDSVLELRAAFGRTMVTALIRVEGRPMGLIANNPKVLGGAIDSDGSDKAARFLQICEAFDLPVLSLSDTPGMMVGPEVEKTALVRHCSRLFVIGANLTVPMFSVVLRKSYGLGALAMTGGSYPASMFSVAWPTGEFAGMGIEGAVKLGYRNELAAIEDPKARRAKFEEMVAAAYENGKALNYASTYAIDDVIDPKDTRRWIMTGLRSLPPLEKRRGKKLKWIDAW